MQHGGAEILEIGDILAGPLAYGAGEIYPAAFHDYVYVVAGPAEETVAHISAYDEGPHPLGCGDFAHDAEYFAVKELCCRGHSLQS